MNRMTRKIVSFALVLMLVLSMLPASVFAAANNVPVKAASVPTKAAGTSVQDGVTLHCWNWSFANIEANLDKIAAAGYTAIQTSPIQPLKEGTDQSFSTYGNQWWVYYQPIEFKINTSPYNALGTKAQFKSMCAAAEAKGIKVIVDVVANHLADNGANEIHINVPSYLRSNSAYWHDISKNTDNWWNRYDVTQYCLAGLPDLNTANKDIQNYVLSFLKECVDAGADGFRFDAAKHIEVPDDAYCGSDFWPTVINGIKSYKSDVYVYGEMLDDTGGISFDSYTKYMSITDNRWSDNVRENVINSGSAGNFSAYYNNNVAANKLVLWAESHDTYGNKGGASMYDSTQNINKTWALVAARADAMSLYLARPESFGIKLGVASTNTGWNWAEVAAVNKFHNHFAGQGEYISNSNGYAMVERGTSGAVIVNVGSDGNVNIPVNKMANGTYIDQISGSTFTVSNGRITGKISHQCGYAVIYNACDHSWFTTVTKAATCTTEGASKSTCSKCGDSKTDVIPAKGHTYSNDKCTVCGAAKPADHVLYFSNSGKWTKVNVYYWSDSNTTMTTWPGKAMTSVGNGVYTYTVPADATYVIFNNGQDGDTNKTADLTIPATSNYYKDGAWTTYSSCTSHTYTEKVTTAATCDKAGVKTLTCSKCGNTKTETIAALGHQYVSGVCTTCGAKEPCTSHSWNAGSVTTAATCIKTGVKTYTCTKCATTKTETIAALGHKFVNGTCATCGQSEIKDTVTVYFQNNWLWTQVKIYFWGSKTATNPTWPGVDMKFHAEDVIDEQTTYDIYTYEVPADVTGFIISGIKNDGSNYRDQTPDLVVGEEDGVCYYMIWDSATSKNAVGSEDIDVMLPPTESECSHNYTSKVTAPTCTAKGYTTYTCTKCGDSYVADEVAALGHTMSEATCTAPATCSVCGATEGEALGHASVTYSYVNNVHTFTCDVCGEVAFTKTEGKKFNFSSVAPALSDDIVMTYTVRLPAGFELSYVTFELNGETTYAYEWESYVSGGVNYANVKFPGLNPQKMGDVINATAYAIVDGYTVSISKENFGFVDYCNLIMDKAPSESLRVILSNVLVYGAKTQAYQGYKLEEPILDKVTFELNATPLNNVPTDLNVMKMVGTTNQAVKFSSVGLVLSGKMTMRYTIKTTTPENYTYRITINGVNYDYTAEDLVADENTAGVYYLNFDQIKATQFGLTITACFLENGVQTSKALEYSVYSYVAMNQGTGDAALADLLKAIYNYGESAKNV